MEGAPLLRVLLHLDGLLVRFGRPVPDAVGLAAALRRLRGRLERGPRRGALEVEAVRFAAADGADGGELGDGSDDAAGLPLRRLPGAEGLGGGSLLFTTSHARCAEALVGGAEAWLVGLGVEPQERGTAFADAPRLVEERLRVPTARPVADAVRTGGLLAIPVGSAAAARRLALEAIAEDPGADWVQLAGALVLYTEEPDLEDRLASRPGVERLSYGVRREDLALDLAGAAEGGGEALWRQGGFRLRESTEADVPGSGEDTLLWDRARRRVFGDGETTGTGAPAAPPPRGEEYRRLYADHLRRLGAAGGDPHTLLTQVRESRGAAAAADLGKGDRPMLAWTTPYRDAERDDLPILVYGPAAATAPEPVAGPAVACALAATDLLSGHPASPGALHCVPLPPPGGGEPPWSRFLLVDERSRAIPFRVDPARLEEVPGVLAAVLGGR